MRAARSGGERNMHYRYVIEFEDGGQKTVDIRLDPATLRLQADPPAPPPPWTLLDNHKCPMCPLSSREHSCCPIALNLAGIMEVFSDKNSTTTVSARVISPEREYFKKTTLQSVMSSLVGLYMAASGCPVMRMLTPMVRFHLPFATLPETIHRSVSSYLLRQYLRKEKGLEPDWDLKNLNAVYKDIEALNAAFTERVKTASTGDANTNAVAILDVFAKMVPWHIGRGLLAREFPLAPQDEE